MKNFISAVCVAHLEEAIHPCLANSSSSGNYCPSPITGLVTGSGDLSCEICILMGETEFKAERDETRLQ